MLSLNKPSKSTPCDLVKAENVWNPTITKFVLFLYYNTTRAKKLIIINIIRIYK
jgi:hypothetical protein